MKSRLEPADPVKTEIKYPILLTDPLGSVVFFSSEKEGVTVFSGIKESYIGGRGWDASGRGWTLFTGTVHLSND